MINALAAFTFTLHKANSHSWRHLQDQVLSTGGRLACSLAAGSLLARSGQNMPYKTKNQLKQEEPTCSVGVPRIRKILNNWSISESPWTDKMCVEKMQKKGELKTWKRGFAPIISATMAPNDQMSIGVEYLAQPSKISGALAREESQCLNQKEICWNIEKQAHLYHRVTTSWV